MRENGAVARALDDGYREAVLTTPVCGGATCHIGNLSRAERTLDGILFLNQIADPTHWSDRELDRMVDEWIDFAPVGVEADPAYLATLSRHAERRGKRLQARFVDLTYELTTRAQRRAIARAVDAPLYDLYGATEAGVLLMQCERGLLHANAAHVHVELQPVGERLARVYVTTLDRAWMPLLRYDTADLVRTREDGAPPCGCGRDFALAERVEGRAHDAIDTGGRTVTAAALDDAIDRPGLSAWQLQLGPAGEELIVTLDEGAPPSLAEEAAEAAGRLIDRPVRARAGAVAPEGSGKYRQLKRVDW
jgi:phenylacetate-coenzyme A ligase PaaK-like adenylate-forming protein